MPSGQAIRAVESASAAGMLWVYGGGTFGRSVRRALLGRGFNVAGFIDRAKGGGTIEDCPAVTPDQLPCTADTVVVIGVLNSGHPWNEILEWARGHGVPTVLTPIDAVDLLPEISSFWLGPRPLLLDAKDEILAVANDFADEQSLDVYTGIVAFRLTGDPKYHPHVSADDQYLPRDLRESEFQFKRPIRFLDGGAYVGDTGLFLVRNGIAIDTWAAFEPDIVNFAELIRNGQTMPDTNRLFFPLGLADEVADYRFDAGAGSSSRFDDTASGSVRCVAVDDVLRGFAPDYVKLDIEGAEEVALNGMRQTLLRSRPHLAISMYHKPLDIVHLVRQVQGLLPSARLYLRQHAFNCFETVLYACG
jgi:FkbM family methyltransferase